MGFHNDRTETAKMPKAARPALTEIRGTGSKVCEIFGRFCGVGISARSGIVRQLENDLVLFTATYRLD